MDESTFSGVNEGASTPSSDAPSASMANDSVGIQEATPAPGPGAETTTAQVATQEVSGDATAAEIDPFDEQVAQIPEHQREKFNSLLQHKKSLEKDLKDARSQWGALSERYGDAAAIAEKLARLDGLGSYATDSIGETVFDQNGLPRVTTSPWLERLATDSPGLVDQLSYDLFNLKLDDGQSIGSKMFWEYFSQMGLDPGRVKDYAQLPASQVASSQVTPDELTYIDESQHSTYRSLTKPERDFVQSLIAEATTEKDQEAAEYLKAAQRRQENEQRLEAFTQYQQKQQQAEVQTFWHGVETATGEAIQKANTNALTGLSQQISSQVTFSADPTTNTIQTNMVTGLIAAICSPDVRFAVQPVLEGLGVTLDPSLDKILQGVTQAEKAYQSFAALEQTQIESLRSQRNALQMQEARRESDRLQQQAMAKLAPLALKIAKAIAGGNQGIREASQQDLAKIQSRPSVGNGTVSNAPSGAQRYPMGREFDLSYRPQ